jgi:hypothetical protein
MRLTVCDKRAASVKKLRGGDSRDLYKSFA